MLTGGTRHTGRRSGLLAREVSALPGGRGGHRVQTYRLARDTLGWTSDEYQQWLASTLARLIAAAGPGG